MDAARWVRPVVAIIAAALLAGAAPSAAQGTGFGRHRPKVREQWQPRTEHDARLLQPVRLEILGRAAVPALALLSDATDVTLRVAPEDVDTVGERKLTIIAQGCDLKSLMVQLPKALQECHWDVDSSGPEPVYLLHRNGGAEAMIADLAAHAAGEAAWRRSAREARTTAAQQALGMSPDELDELEQSDPLLARAVQDTETRRWMELFLSLPPDQMAQFTGNGAVGMDLTAAPEPAQEAVRGFLEAQLAEATRRTALQEINLYQRFLDNAGKVYFCYEDSNDLGDSGDGTWLRLSTYDTRGERYSTGPMVLPPRLPGRPARLWRDLLIRTGTTDRKQAGALLSELVSAYEQEANEMAEQQHWTGQAEPADAALRRVFELEADSALELADIERLLANRTRFSVVSDYFTAPAWELPEEASAGLPLWRLLNLLGESVNWRWHWERDGDCLAFHQRYWYLLLTQEAPESVIQACRDKLRAHRMLTLDDVAAVSSALAGRPVPVPAGINLPADLERAGLPGDRLLSEPLLLYAALSPPKRQKARRAEGLPYAEMNRRQRELVRQAAAQAPWDLSAQQISEAIFHVSELVSEESPERSAKCDLTLTFPGYEARVSLVLTPSAEAED